MLKQSKGNRAQRIFDFLHQNIIIIIIVAVVLAGAISTIAIVRNDTGNEEAESGAVEYQPMKTVYFAMAPAENLNVLASSDRDVYYISQLVYSSLFKLDDTLNIVPDLVDSYETNAKEGSVEIKLKKDVKFSDGSKLTASDVNFTINRILSIGTGSPYYSYVNNISYVQVFGDYSLAIHFDKPSDAALDNLVFPIVSSADYTDSTSRVIGSGPYRFRSYDSGKYLNLSPNKHYYGTKAENKVQFKVVSDDSRITGLMTMEAVTASVSQKQDADADAEDKDLLVTKIPSCEVEYLGFNFKNKVLARKEVRQAIAKLIDTETLIKDNYGGAGIQSDSIYFPGFLGSENQKDAYSLDQKGALTLFEKAGFRDENEDGVLEDANGKKLSLEIIVNRGNGSRVDTARGIADGLEDIGIGAKVKVLDWESYQLALKEGEFDLYLGGYKLDKKCDLRELFDEKNRIGYANAEIIGYVNQLETCLTAEKQKQVYEKLKPLLNEELPYYGLCYKTYTFITVPQFTAEVIPMFFDVYRGCGNWQWQKTVTRDLSQDEGKEGAEKETE